MNLKTLRDFIDNQIGRGVMSIDTPVIINGKEIDTIGVDAHAGACVFAIKTAAGGDSPTTQFVSPFSTPGVDETIQQVEYSSQYQTSMRPPAPWALKMGDGSYVRVGEAGVHVLDITPTPTGLLPGNNDTPIKRIAARAVGGRTHFNYQGKQYRATLSEVARNWPGTVFGAVVYDRDNNAMVFVMNASDYPVQLKQPTTTTDTATFKCSDGWVHHHACKENEVGIQCITATQAEVFREDFTVKAHAVSIVAEQRGCRFTIGGMEVFATFAPGEYNHPVVYRGHRYFGTVSYHHKTRSLVFMTER